MLWLKNYLAKGQNIYLFHLFVCQQYNTEAVSLAVIIFSPKVADDSLGKQIELAAEGKCQEIRPFLRCTVYLGAHLGSPVKCDSSIMALDTSKHMLWKINLSRKCYHRLLTDNGQTISLTNDMEEIIINVM